MNYKQTIGRTITRWANGIGIVSMASQERLRDMLVAALPEPDETDLRAQLTAAAQRERGLRDMLERTAAELERYVINSRVARDARRLLASADGMQGGVTATDNTYM